MPDRFQHTLANSAAIERTSLHTGEKITLTLQSRLSSILILAIAVALTGCRPTPVDPRLLGTFVAANGEALDFVSDGWISEVWHSDGQKRRVLLGYTRRVDHVSDVMEIFGPDSSSLLGTRFQFNGSFKSVTVKWKDLGTSNEVRQTQFEKKIDG